MKKTAPDTITTWLTSAFSIHPQFGLSVIQKPAEVSFPFEHAVVVTFVFAVITVQGLQSNISIDVITRITTAITTTTTTVVVVIVVVIVVIIIVVVVVTTTTTTTTTIIIIIIIIISVLVIIAIIGVNRVNCVISRCCKQA